jgi:dGTPase
VTFGASLAPDGTAAIAVPMSSPWACRPQDSLGRRFPEAEAPTRSVFQRDRDRIIHSTAFRRLVYKTQVFLNHEGDLFRTRLTHSLEVAQLGRSIARTLGLDEDLVEAIALAHDLGHTPFGHAGQDALHASMQAQRPPQDTSGETWGFEHNIQSLRVIDKLEERYAAFDGLNLCYETREGVLKHCAPSTARRLMAGDHSGVAQRFVLGGSPSLEAQLCNLADEIAYNAHDIDDGVRSGLLSLEQLAEVPLFERYRLQVLDHHPRLVGRRLLFETIRRMLSEQVYDVIDATRQRILDSGVRSVAEVRTLKAPLVSFSPEMRVQSQTLKSFLLRNLYRHPQVMDTTERAARVVGELFALYLLSPGEMPHPVRDVAHPARAVADYIAGMTDRFAIREHQRLSGTVLFPPG